MVFVATTALMVGLMWSVYYPQLPDPMPVHWNGKGVADNWEPKTIGNFLILVLMAPVIIFLTLLGAQALLVMQSGALAQKEASEARKQWRIYDATNTHMGWYLSLLNLIILLMLVNSLRPPLSTSVMIFGLIAICAATIALVIVLVRVTQQAEREYPTTQRGGARAWGIFYRDPEDSRILVETGPANFTFNIAHTWGKVGAIGLLGLPVVVIIAVIVL